MNENINSGYISPTRKKKKKLIIIIIAAALLIVALSVSGLYIYITSLSDEEKIIVQGIEDQISNIGAITLSSDEILSAVEEKYYSLSLKLKLNVRNRGILFTARESLTNLQIQNVTDNINAIGNVNSASGESIALARNSYNQLPREIQDKIANYKVLEDAETVFNNLVIAETTDAINLIGTVTLNSGEQITKARNLYDELNSSQQASVSNYSVLAAAEAAYSKLTVDNLISLINEIGLVTLESKSAIEAAESAYNALDPSLQKEIINYNVLTDARAAYTILENEEYTFTSGDTISTSDFSITFNTARITETISPDDTSGPYEFYFSSNDLVFVDMVFKIENLSSGSMKYHELVDSVKVVYNETDTYSTYSLFASQGDTIIRITDGDSLEASDTATLHVAVSIPEEAEDNNYPIKVYITIAGEEHIINFR